jgi:hypothetical protein
MVKLENKADLLITKRARSMADCSKNLPFKQDLTCGGSIQVPRICNNVDFPVPELLPPPGYPGDGVPG